VIVNIPTAENLNMLALRLHFGAWSDLLSMKTQFEDVFPGDSANDWSTERAEYFTYCQPELQSICTMIQQSNELALKGRICQVSPFLLLLNSNPPFSTVPNEIDFATLRTLDAVDLPAAVNSLCPLKLSDKVVQTYNQVRSTRNQIAHLGTTDRQFLPDDLLHLLVAQYRELWPSRAWLQDRVEFAAQTRTAFFHDGRYTSAHMIAMEELGSTFEVLTKSEFKGLFGRDKSKRRYKCHDCIYQASTKYFDPSDGACKTAFLEPTGDSLWCAMCGKVMGVLRAKCPHGGCEGDVIAKDGDYAGQCHTCGEPMH